MLAALTSTFEAVFIRERRVVFGFSLERILIRTSLCPSVYNSFCGGLYLDIKRKLPWLPSDFYEGFHIQSISAVLFIYLGCITNAITFGGLLGDATDNYQVKQSAAVGKQNESI